MSKWKNELKLLVARPFLFYLLEIFRANYMESRQKLHKNLIRNPCITPSHFFRAFCDVITFYFEKMRALRLQLNSLFQLSIFTPITSQEARCTNKTFH